MMPSLLPDFSLCRKWMDLTPIQWQAIEQAAKKVTESSQAQALLERDVNNLVADDWRLASTDEELAAVYGEPLYQAHPALVLLCRLPWLVEQYQTHGIADSVLRDSLLDMRIWMDVCEKRTGHPGMKEYGWLSNTFRFQLFRLDRLQFVCGTNGIPAFVYRHRETGQVTALCPDGAVYCMNGEAEGTNGCEHSATWTAFLRQNETFVEGFPILPIGLARPDAVRLSLAEWELALKPGDPVLHIHIPEGAPLSAERVAHSFSMAPDFFRDHLGRIEARAFTCGSWLLDNSLAQIQPQGNIAHFQQCFHLVPTKGANDEQTRERAFGDRQADILTAPCHTSLQKGILAWYRSGRRCRGADGFILL